MVGDYKGCEAQADSCGSVAGRGASLLAPNLTADDAPEGKRVAKAGSTVGRARQLRPTLAWLLPLSNSDRPNALAQATIGRMSDAERIDLPGEHDKARQLAELYEAEILERPPGSFSDAPEGKALVWVVVNDEPLPELAYYVYNEAMFARLIRESQEDFEPSSGAVVLGPGNARPTTWLLLDRAVADRLCPEAAALRRSWEADIAAETDLAAHPDNLLPVARISRMKLRMNAEALRRYAGEMDHAAATPRHQLEDPGGRRAAAADLREIAHDLESWAERDWVAVIELDAGREHLDGPLPPLPGA